MDKDNRDTLIIAVFQVEYIFFINERDKEEYSASSGIV